MRLDGGPLPEQLGSGARRLAQARPGRTVKPRLRDLIGTAPEPPEDDLGWLVIAADLDALNRTLDSMTE